MKQIKRLHIFRQQIDAVDRKILMLLKKRFIIVKKIGTWKKQNNIQVQDNIRWKKVLRLKIQMGDRFGISKDCIKTIYEAVHAEALLIENNL